MTEVIGRNQLATRRRILDEYRKVQKKIARKPELWRKLSFEAHKKICESQGDDFIDYPQFEFWFSRFALGNFDLDYDRSSDSNLSFTDLPLDVFENIGEYLKLEDRMQLRNVCKDVRFQVDNWNLKLTEISYSRENDGIFSNRFCSGSSLNSISFVLNVLKLPNLQLEKLTIREDVYWKELIEELDESNRKLHVKKVVFPNHYRSSKIDLHFLVPGVLEEIEMNLMNPTREELYKIIKSEQCQTAMVFIDSWTVISKFPLDVLYKCPRFTLRLEEESADDLKANFINTLMKYGEVQKCVLYLVGPSDLRYLPREFLERFDEPKTLRRYPIPGTNDFYELEYREKFIRLERKH